MSILVVRRGLQGNKGLGGDAHPASITVANNIDNVNAVGDDIANVNTCVTNLAEIIDAPTQAAAASASAAAAAASAAGVNLPSIGVATQLLKVNAGGTALENAAKLPDFTASKQGAILLQNAADDGFSFLNTQGVSQQFLGSNGPDADPSFQTIEDNLILLSEQDASASANINFDSSLITTTYKKYIFELIDVIPATDGQFLDLLVSEDNGSTIKTTSSYDYMNITQTSAAPATLTAGGSASAASLLLTGQGTGSTAGESLCLTVVSYDPLGTVSHKKFTAEGTSENSSGDSVHIRTAGNYISTVNAVNYIRFAFQSGNIASGKFKLYGVK